ncbi:MAG TPA: ATP-binding protein [Chloroflexota bacterium]|nr:ATP-binding protein [Chloroflexota bacterium]
MPLPSPRALPIRIRLAVAYALFVILTFTVVGMFVLASLKDGMERQANQTLGIRASLVQTQLTVDPDGQLRRAEVARILAAMSQEDDLEMPVIWVQVVDASGAVLASIPDGSPAQLPPTRDLIATALGGQDAAANTTLAGDRIRVLAHPIADGGRVVGVVLVAESLHLIDETFQEVAWLLTIAAVVSALVAMAGGWWLTGRALGPVAAVTRTARAIAGTGEFDQRISPPPADDELRDLIATFNEMLARLARTFQRQREFLGNASHELRGPLTVIQGNLDLLRLDLPEVERQLSVDTAANEVARMSRLVADLLFLAEVDTHQTVRHELVRLDAVVAETWRRASLVDSGSHELLIAANAPTTIRGDRDRLSQAIANLVQNALSYTPLGGAVTLRLENRGSTAELSVADTGIGIAAEHLPHIFERFYRVDRARTRVASSTGLGLAIVKEVVEAHGGQIQVVSEPGQGSTFTVTLPTEDPVAAN